MSSLASENVLGRVVARQGNGGETAGPCWLNATDEDLMSGMKTRNHDAASELFDRYSHRVFAVALRILRDHGEAQELTQDVFLSVYRKANLYDSSKGSFRVWLMQLTYYRAFDRREYLDKRMFYSHMVLDDVADVPGIADDLEHRTDMLQWKVLLESAFEQLSDVQRVTLELYFLYGYSLREISERLDESIENTRHHYYRGLDRLRRSSQLATAAEAWGTQPAARRSAK